MLNMDRAIVSYQDHGLAHATKVGYGDRQFAWGGNGIRGSVPNIEDDAEANEWPIDENNSRFFVEGFSRKIADDPYCELLNKARKGVQVSFSVHYFSLSQAPDHARSKTTARKASWPYKSRN